MSSQFDSTVDSDQKAFNSAINGAVAASVISTVVLIIAVTAIICAIINCVQKSGNSIPISARVTSSDGTDNYSSNNKVAVDLRRDQFPVAFDSQAEFPTIKGFLSNMAREKPITYSAKQIAEFTHNYSYSNILGSGGFGVVYKGLLENGVQVAVKVLTNNNRAKIVEEQFMAEVGALGRTYHVNLVRLYGFCFAPEMKALIYEYMENGSLDKLLFSENGEVDLEKLHVIAVQTAKGLAYLHEECEQKIIHYDIKPENVLLDENLNPKVADFGLAKLCNRGSSRMLLTNFRGTAGYAAPEMWNPYPVTHKCDVYSFGILLFEIVGRRRHCDDNVSESRDWLPKWTWNMFEKNDLAALLLRCGIEERDMGKAERMLMIALWCIQHSPEARPLMSNVVQMLEGHKEITPPPCPFEHLQSPQLNFSQNSGTDDDTSSSASAPMIDSRPSVAHEIELVVE
ncbi:LEAF RUST 10 DISEASE-RESISTANCE LOCUS RECEPTOR-LIKE PROTEIN KINASE-like 2.2 [Rosa sericea]